MKNTLRINLWDTPLDENPETPAAGMPLPSSQQPGGPLSIVQRLRVAERKKRDRGWEGRPENRPTTFRGVPPALHAEVKAIAHDLNVRVDDVARAFLEFSLQCHRKGELVITPCLSRERLTLYPEGAGWSGKQRPGWYERVWEEYARPSQPEKNRRNPEPASTKSWRWPKVSYRRLPTDLTAEIQRLHHERNVPTGEIVTLFLSFALDAYRSGHLILDPQPASSPPWPSPANKPANQPCFSETDNLSKIRS
jgi:hypothetical protein